MKAQHNIQRTEPDAESPAHLRSPIAEGYQILIADDSEDDKFLLRTSIARVPRLKIAAEVSNGTEVVAYFNAADGRTKGRDAPPFPDLLLLDLNMPFMDGFEVLHWLRAQNYDELTVVVLTDSVHPNHIKRALDLGADYYQLKTRSSHDRHAMALAFERYLSGVSGAESSSGHVERLRL